MIRILHYIGSLECGGSQSMIMNIYRNINRNDIQFDFVCHDEQNKFYNEEIKKIGGKIFYCPKYRGKNHLKYKKWWNDFFMSHTEYKIFHCHVRSTSYLCIKIAKKYGLYTIAHSHNTSNGSGFPAFVKNIFQYQVRNIADYFFSCSKEAGVWMFGENIVCSKRFFILKNAIDAKKYNYDLTIRKEYRNRLEINDSFVIGTVGRLVDQKNPFFIIELLKDIKKKLPDFIFLWIGTGELETKIKTLLYEYKLHDNVKMIGVVPNVCDYLQAMDVFIFPSKYEGLGIVAVEAQAAGLPTICSEGVSPETNISDLIEYISLDKPAEYWVNEILKHKNGYIRTDRSEDIIKAGYNIKNVAEDMQNFYLKINKQ